MDSQNRKTHELLESLILESFNGLVVKTERVMPGTQTYAFIYDTNPDGKRKGIIVTSAINTIIRKVEDLLDE